MREPDLLIIWKALVPDIQTGPIDTWEPRTPRWTNERTTLRRRVRFLIPIKQWFFVHIGMYLFPFFFSPSFDLFFVVGKSLDGVQKLTSVIILESSNKKKLSYWDLTSRSAVAASRQAPCPHQHATCFFPPQPIPRPHSQFTWGRRKRRFRAEQAPARWWWSLMIVVVVVGGQRKARFFFPFWEAERFSHPGDPKKKRKKKFINEIKGLLFFFWVEKRTQVVVTLWEANFFLKSPYVDNTRLQ